MEKSKEINIYDKRITPEIGFILKNAHEYISLSKEEEGKIGKEVKEIRRKLLEKIISYDGILKKMIDSKKKAFENITNIKSVNDFNFTPNQYAKIINKGNNLIKVIKFDNLIEDELFLKFFLNKFFRTDYEKKENIYLEQNNVESLKTSKKITFNLLQFRKVLDLTDEDFKTNPFLVLNKYKINPISTLSKRDQYIELKNIISRIRFKDNYKEKMVRLFEDRHPKIIDEKEKNIESIMNELITKRNQFIENHQRLVIGIAKRFIKKNSHLLYSDLVQEGIFGLIKAFDSWDYEKGFNFSTYAYTKILATIQKGIYNQEKMIRVPIPIEREMKKINTYKNSLPEKELSYLSDKKISEDTNIPIKNVELIEQYIPNVNLLENPWVDKLSLPSKAFFIPSNILNLEKEDYHKKVFDIILNIFNRSSKHFKKYEDIFKNRYSKGLSLEEISREERMDRKRVYNIMSKIKINLLANKGKIWKNIKSLSA